MENNIMEKIKEIVSKNNVVLFMKGTPQFPQCGFSSRAIALLKANGMDKPYTVNVLANPEIRQGIKEYSNWPTVPQLYVNNKFIGGSDIMSELHESGELNKILNA